MKEIKINNEILSYREGSCQLSLGSHATLYYSFDINKHPDYKSTLLHLFDSRMKFDIISTEYLAKGTLVKTLDIDPQNNFLNLTMRCDILKPLKTDERREDILEQLLNSTFND
jgi:hypothetical protein